MAVTISGTSGIDTLADNTVTTNDIINAAVTTLKIADANITTAKLSSTAISDSFTGSNQSLTTNGYQKLPGGLIVQWLNMTITNSATTITWPIAFPTAVLGAGAMSNQSAAGYAAVYNRTTSGATGIASAVSSAYFVFAIGY